MGVDLPSAAEIRAIVREAVAPLREEVARLRLIVGEETVDVTEAARRLHTTPRTLQRRIRRGEIPAVRGSKGWRIPRSALAPPDRG